MDLIKFHFDEKYTYSNLIIFIDKKLKISLFAKHWDTFAILVNKLMNNVVQVNINNIYIF